VPLEPLKVRHNRKSLGHTAPVLARLRQETLKRRFGIAGLDLSGSTQLPKVGRSFSVAETPEHAGHVGAISPQSPRRQTGQALALPLRPKQIPRSEAKGCSQDRVHDALESVPPRARVGGREDQNHKRGQKRDTQAVAAAQHEEGRKQQHDEQRLEHQRAIQGGEH
jgi:hypothetical protein